MRQGNFKIIAYPNGKYSVRDLETGEQTPTVNKMNALATARRLAREAAVPCDHSFRREHLYQLTARCIYCGISDACAHCRRNVAGEAAETGADGVSRYHRHCWQIAVTEGER